MVIDDILHDLESKIEERRKTKLKLDGFSAGFINVEIAILEDVKQKIQERTEGISYIGWSVEDFKYQASKQKDPSIYDETKFQNALDIMINKHDASIGITWETINIYLDNYCIKETED